MISKYQVPIISLSLVVWKEISEGKGTFLGEFVCPVQGMFKETREYGVTVRIFHVFKKGMSYSVDGY